MPVPPDQRPLTLAAAFNRREGGKQWGWQKVDDTTVLERKRIPYYADWTEGEIHTVQTTVYDFLKYEVTTTSQREDHITSKEGEPARTYVRSFSEIEGKQAIRDAHRALTELGGTPPPLDEIQGIDVALRKDIPVSSPIRLKSQPQ
jgi:hypothetical protein